MFLNNHFSFTKLYSLKKKLGEDVNIFENNVISVKGAKVGTRVD
jgi:hypothetical protein